MSQLLSVREFQPAVTQTINEVDGLLEQVFQIQSRYEHSFTLVEPFRIQESSGANVYVGHNTEIHYSPTFSMVCVKCSKREEGVSPTMMCPSCFVKMRCGEGLLRREQFFGGRHLYYAVRLYSCPQCKFTVAVDEWDQ